MIFEEILRTVDELNDEERRLLRLHIDQLPKMPAQFGDQTGIAPVRRGTQLIRTCAMQTVMALSANEHCLVAWESGNCRISGYDRFNAQFVIKIRNILPRRSTM